MLEESSYSIYLNRSFQLFKISWYIFAEIHSRFLRGISSCSLWNLFLFESLTNSYFSFRKNKWWLEADMLGQPEWIVASSSVYRLIIFFNLWQFRYEGSVQSDYTIWTQSTREFFSRHFANIQNAFQMPNTCQRNI